MKCLARMFVWWPGLDLDIEMTVASCSLCQSHRAAVPTVPLQPWTWPTQPWTRIHMDLAGPFLNQMFLVLIDSYSKWIEVLPLTSTTSTALIQKIRPLFAQFGLPSTVVTDNGTQFVSEEFEKFLKNNGIRHISSAPYHPATNGLAKRAVQIFKAGIRKITDGSTSDCIARILLNYRRTPQTTTGSSPAELMFGRNLRTRLDLLLPNLSARVEQSQSRQKQGHDVHARDRAFTVGSKVFVRDFRGPTKWVIGTILNKFGTYSYSVLLDGAGILVRRHADHI